MGSGRHRRRSDTAVSNAMLFPLVRDAVPFAVVGPCLTGWLLVLIKVPCGQTADGARLLGPSSLPRNKKSWGDVEAHTHSKVSLQVVLQQCSAVRAEVNFLGWLLGRSPTLWNAPLSPEAPACDVRFCVLLFVWGCIAECGNHRASSFSEAREWMLRVDGVQTDSRF